MGKKILILIVFAIVFCASSAQHKTISLKHLSSQEGLSDNQATCIIRDKLGFIWIGTKDGLNRYDGLDFYVFKHNENDSNSVCGNIISCLELDDDSLLWIGTASSGMSSYNFRTGKFKSYDKSNAELFSNSINDIAFDKSRNCLWIAMNNSGLQLFELKTKSTDKKQKLISNNTYYDVLVNDTIPYFTGIIESLKRLGNIGKFRTPRMDTAMTINKIFLASDGGLWCGAWDNGLHRFDKNGVRKATYFFDGSNKLKHSGEEIISLVEDENKILWCGTKSSGMLFFDLKSSSFTNQITFSIPVTARINNLYRDNQNRIWVATEAGLFVYDPLQNQFENVDLPVPSNFISCKVNNRIITDSGNEYVVSQCGLFFKNGSDKKYFHKEFIYRNEKQELTSIYQDKANVIYIGTNRALFILDTLTNELRQIKINEKAKNKKVLGNILMTPLFECCAHYGLPLTLHPNGSEGSIRNSPTHAGSMTRTFVERHAMLAQSGQAQFVSLVLGGALERVPTLKVMFAEFGFSWVGPMMWQMDHVWKRRGGAAVSTARPPSHYAREQVRFTTQQFDEPHKPSHLAFLLEAMHADETLIFSSDYPHWDTDEPQLILTHRLPPKFRERVAYQNAYETFGERLWK